MRIGQIHWLDQDIEIAGAGEADFPCVFVTELDLDQAGFESRESLLGFGNHARVNTPANRNRTENATLRADPHLRAFALRTCATGRNQSGHIHALLSLRTFLDVFKEFFHVGATRANAVPAHASWQGYVLVQIR